ncbi:hypothetical protein [Dehalobacter sp. TeCB1]|uniref:hypothetical protein n=1 Tax=Dehalobacter sp. TeCB1 TaxID=1843715 RepID=UPI00083A7A60|nr:hypothetical protein [Dehalobacter sp. TeCB1]OCZ54313.1 hypothetical protein A7D23_05965 [Dehalobacter sp. TeCB1]
MYKYIEPYAIKEIINNAAITNSEATVAINCRKFMIANTGAQPLYFKEKAIDSVAATAANSMLVPANTVFPQILTAQTLSLISNATGTSYAIMVLDM